MLNVAMVLMILAGIFGLPAAACSTACAGILGAAATDPNTKAGDAAAMATFGTVFLVLALLASVGSIVLGAMVRHIGKVPAGIAALAFALFFVALLIQANPLGLPSALMLLVSSVMIFVAPQPEYTGVNQVQVVK